MNYNGLNTKQIITFLFMTIIYSNSFAVVKTSITSGNWSNASIWSPVGVPLSSDDIIISTGNTVTLTSNVIVRDIDIKSGAVLNGGNFRVEFNIWGILVYTNNGTHNVNIGTSALYFNNSGNGNVDGNGIINGNIEMNSGSPKFLTTCGLTINGDLFSSNPSNNPNTQNDGNIVFNGSISQLGGSFTNNGVLGISNSTSMYGAYIYNAGTFTTTGSVILGANGGTVTHGYTLPFNINGKFYNVGTVTINGDVMGIGTTYSIFYQITGGYAKFGGQVFPSSNDGKLGVYGGINTIEYNGTNQIIKCPASIPHTGAVPNTYSNLIISNSGIKSLECNINVSNTLTLTNGILYTGIYECNVTNTALAAVTSYSTSSYVDGYLRRAVLANGGIYDFPVGNSTSYQLATINLLGTHTVGNLLVNFSNLPAGTGLPLTEGSATYSTILNCGGTAPGTGNTNDGVWTITPNTGTANYDVTLYGRNYSNAAAGNTILKRTDASSAWSLLGSYVASTGSEPLIAKRTGFSGFSQFAIGSSEIALPIELTSFTANCQYNGVLLNWTTASEINNDFFTIEKSVDAVNWDEIGTILGAGNSNEFLNYSFIDDNVHANQVTYYQLKQTDFDGSSRTFNITPINCNSDKEPIIYPTLAVKHINIDSEKQPITEYTISDLTGTVVLKKKYNSENKLTQVKVNIQSISKGIYVITILSEKKVYASKFIKQ